MKLRHAWRGAAALSIGLAVPTPSQGNLPAAEGASTPVDPDDAAIVRSVCRPPDCVRTCADADEGRSAVTYVQRGAFSAHGVEEALVSLFPCGEAGSLRYRGTLALVRRGPRGWRQVATTSDAIFGGECRVQHSPDRDLLFCQTGVGPNRGIMTDSLCAVFWKAGQIAHDCPLIVTDVTFAGCLSGLEGATRRTWTARVASWAERPFGQRPGAVVEVEYAVASLKGPAPESGSDAECHRAVRRVEKLPLQKLRLEAVFDGQRFSLTPESEALKKRHATIFE
jgi:hypothetical protein